MLLIEIHIHIRFELNDTIELLVSQIYHVILIHMAKQQFSTISPWESHPDKTLKTDDRGGVLGIRWDRINRQDIWYSVLPVQGALY